MLTVDNDIDPQNKRDGIVVKYGKVTFIRLVQLDKEPLPSVIDIDGKSILVRVEQLLKP